MVSVGLILHALTGRVQEPSRLSIEDKYIMSTRMRDGMFQG